MTETQDYVAPPFFLSEEKTESEVAWSRGRYLEPEEVWKAFHARGQPPPRSGVGMNQPWPWAASATSIYSSAAVFLGVLGLLFIGFAVMGGRSVYSQDVTILPTATPGSPEAAAFSERFTLPSTGNVEVRFRAPVDNSWLYVDGALINDDSGAVDDFDAEVSYYHGVDSDGSWSEGGQEARAYVGSVPAGTYILRLAPQWEPNHAPSGYTVSVRSRVPRFYQALLAALALAAWPLLLAWRHFRFEAQRWMESDHPWVSSGGDDE